MFCDSLSWLETKGPHDPSIHHRHYGPSTNVRVLKSGVGLDGSDLAVQFFHRPAEVMLVLV